MRVQRIGFVLAGLLVALVGAAASVHAGHHESQQQIVVHIGHFTDDLHAVSMALALATNLQKGDVSVTVFLDREGVRLADSRVPQDLRWGSGASVAERYAAFVEAGGSFLLCAHCSEAAGVAAPHLRKGARIASDAEVRDLFERADKVIGY